MKKTARGLLIALCALLMAVAPGMDFHVQPKALPDGTGLVDMLYQTIARTTAAFSTDSLALVALAAVFFWMASRTLFRGRRTFRIGEALLCAFLSAMMLLNRGIRAENTVRLLYENGFQVMKSALYFVGMYLIDLTACRLLREALENRRFLSGAGSLARWAQGLTFGRSLLVIAIVWLPQIFIKYPGVLMWDTFHQIKQFIGDYPRMSNHPPFGTLLYGLMYRFGMLLSNVNIGYFLFMLVQAAALAAVLAWSLAVMRRQGVPPWVRIGALALYALSPCYAGWATVICKDTMYLTLCLFIGVLLMEAAHELQAFLHDTRRLVLLGGSCVLLWLTRLNGLLVVAAVFLGLAVLMLSQKCKARSWLRIGALALCAVVLSLGVNEALIRTLNVRRVYMYDVLTLPFQQTALAAKRNPDAIPEADRATIDRVLDYALIAERGGSWYADAVKDTYRDTATASDRAAYLRVWAKQMFTYPIDYLDATLIMNGVLFDMQFNRPMYVGLTDNTLTDAVYPYSYNDMSLYNSAEIVPLNAAQRMLTQWYFSFDDLPVVGLLTTMGFATTVLLLMLYQAVRCGRKRALLVMIPSVVTMVGCLFVPVAYLRYALPYVCSLPLWFAAFYGTGGSGQPEAQAEMGKADA